MNMYGKLKDFYEEGFLDESQFNELSEIFGNARNTGKPDKNQVEFSTPSRMVTGANLLYNSSVFMRRYYIARPETQQAFELAIRDAFAKHPEVDRIIFSWEQGSTVVANVTITHASENYDLRFEIPHLYIKKEA